MHDEETSENPSTSASLCVIDLQSQPRRKWLKRAQRAVRRFAWLYMHGSPSWPLDEKGGRLLRMRGISKTERVTDVGPLGIEVTIREPLCWDEKSKRWLPEEQ